LPGRALRGRGAELAPRERLLEDPAAGARAPGRGRDLRLLPVRPASAALQPGAGAGGRGRAGRRVRRPPTPVRRRLLAPLRGGAGRRGCPRGGGGGGGAPGVPRAGGGNPATP